MRGCQLVRPFCARLLAARASAVPLLSAVLLLQLLFLLPSPARASDLDPPGGKGTWQWRERVYHWHYSRNAEPAWLERGMGASLFRSAADAWAACGVRLEFEGETDRLAGAMDGMNVAGWSAQMQRPLRGLTTRRRAATALVEADVAINARSAELRASPELLFKVILHEFGHALGLVHSTECRDVMSFGGECRVPARDLPQRPAAGDLAQCAARYGPETAPK